MSSDRQAYLVAFLRGCASAADKGVIQKVVYEECPTCHAKYNGGDHITIDGGRAFCFGTKAKPHGPTEFVGTDLAKLLVNGDLMREAADELLKTIGKDRSPEEAPEYEIVTITLEHVSPCLRRSTVEHGVALLGDTGQRIITMLPQLGTDEEITLLIERLYGT